MKSVTKEILTKQLASNEATVLNSLLAAEISAVETYNKAIQNIKHPELIPVLERCRDSHALRIFRLRQCLIDMGATPVETSGFFGSVAKLVEKGASLMGDQSAIAVLAGGEDFDLHEYKSSLSKVDEKSRNEIAKRIIPAQEKTLSIINTLCVALQEIEQVAKSVR